MNLLAEVDKIKQEGYSEANAQAKLCQDIIVKAISESSLNRNVTIKGGVVMRSLSNSARRATQDIDLDFIRYSISEDSIKMFISKLNCLEGISLKMVGTVEELRHQDYQGKRIHVEISDSENNTLAVKMDIGVHKDLDIAQEEYCFDISFQDDSASVLINSKEQIVTEKLKSLMRFGTRSTRYKDIFDICYLSEKTDLTVLRQCISKYIFEDETLNIHDNTEIHKRAARIFNNSTFKKHVESSKKNWLGLPLEDVMRINLEFINKI